MKEFTVIDFNYYSRVIRGAGVYMFIGIFALVCLSIIFLATIRNETGILLTIFFLSVFLFTCVGFSISLYQNRIFLYSIIFTKEKVELLFKKNKKHFFSKSILLLDLQIKIEDIDSRNTYRIIFFNQNKICFVQTENRIWTSDMFKEILIYFNYIKNTNVFYNYIREKNINNFKRDIS